PNTSYTIQNDSLPAKPFTGKFGVFQQAARVNYIRAGRRNRLHKHAYRTEGTGTAIREFIATKPGKGRREVEFERAYYRMEDLMLNIYPSFKLGALLRISTSKKPQRSSYIRE